MSLIQDVCDNLSNGSSRDIENLLNCIDYCSIGETFLEETGFFVHCKSLRDYIFLLKRSMFQQFL